ncbi:MAG: hypothetical protein PF517_14955 [Salinivirgaceae bacterium]|jgi:hypothetical protein|nr:hypothetical protein [Salinivirgaceae bacterium]
MKLNLKTYSFKLGILMLSLGTVHLLFYRGVPDFLGLTLRHIIEIYVFLAALNITHFIGLRWLFKKWAKYAGLLFTALSMVKMGVAIIFLFPYIFPSTDQSIPMVLNFMVVYFSTLTFEVIFIAKKMTKI